MRSSLPSDLILCMLAILTPQLAQAAEPLISVDVGGTQYVGANQAHDAREFWLLERDGQLRSFPLADVTDFRRVSETFRPYSAAQVRDQLRVKLGRTFEIKATTHYLVCAAPGHAARYAELFEGLYREFYVYLSARKFPVRKPEFPLVAIIFPTQADFAAYAKTDGINAGPGLAGYYQLRTNRVAAYDPNTARRTAQASSFESVAPLQLTVGEGPILGRESAVSSSLQETIIHEATHQVAFNVGLHSRIGPAPRWVVEGLAMVFEHPDSRSAVRTTSARQRLNRQRYVWFQNYRSSRRPDQLALKTFIEEDRLFQTATLDAYSEAWALTFFLMETRNSAYAGYLKTIAERDPLKPYPASQRRADFEAAFGANLEMLNAEYLRFVDRL